MQPILHLIVLSVPQKESSLSVAYLQYWWAVLMVILVAITAIIYLSYRYTTLRDKSKKILLEQQQFIRAERQRISGEIHDDIGSGLFAIQLFADTASKNRTDVAEIKQISGMVNEMSEKIHEIIWSTNSEGDNLENLLYYIEHQTIKLFEYTDIKYIPDFPMHVPEVIINSQGRRNTYLVVKETVYNAIKHAKATEVSTTVTVSNGVLLFIIKDNGIGFDPKDARHNAMGLKNIKKRIEKLNGSLILENYKGTIVKIKIPLKEFSS
ncbi:sensor histidine kinase [Pedobacter namyangjuensis]|uniref:sensor histidine kinase n=1 Tax=Pedobacter namyangjuensis TaxID=600626 RepID=UPI000DE56BA0|nr:ATP-binding protein [Pedobacter namyangjuensis]